LIRRSGDPPLWRVVVGREQSIESAKQLADRVRSRVSGEVFVVRLDDAGLGNPGGPAG
jgi:hypothetical protein